MKGPRTTGSAQQPARGLFLARRSYRQRRLRDVLRMVPVLALILWLVPLLWRADPENIRSTSAVGIYVFGVWVLMILIGAGISAMLRPDDETDDTESAD